MKTNRDNTSRKSRFNKIKGIFWTLAIAGLVHVVIIVGFGLIDTDQEADLIMVLGSKVEENGEPAKRLQYRLNKGAELYQAGKANTIIVSGGIGKEGFDEAEVMANYLIERGIPAEAIIRDNQGNTTYASVQNARQIMKVRGDYSLLVVSQYFHLLRATIACNRMGIPVVYSASSDWFFEWRDLYSIPREIVGLYYYVFREYD